MELLNKEMHMLFPTALFTGQIPDLSVADRIEKKLYELKDAGQGTRDSDRVFISQDDLQTLPEFKELSDLALLESHEILNVYRIKRESHYITNMWANITHPNHRHHMHIHPNCLLSGIFYVKTPKNCGPTIFGDPRLHARMIEPTFTEQNVHNSSTFYSMPEKGRMVMWPSYLSHGVEIGRAMENEDRIVVAFNIMIRGVIDRQTARLDLR
jgi:uncharacterized protein (TIGR02466 family)